jgi:crotonobetainyl-CoA:carnitine CoA-transferase CaiB-like acyl-CoA transferase
VSDTFLADLVVVELGERLSAGLCGALMYRLGAEVWVPEPPEVEHEPGSKWAHHALLGAGKRGLVADTQTDEGAEQLRTLVERADVVVTSSDWQPAFGGGLGALLRKAPLVCDVSAFGSSGPLAGEAYTDGMLQAFAGLVDTTGSSERAPVASRIPLAECTTAVFAAAGILAGLLSRRRSARAHRVEVAMFDTAVSMLSTFLPTHIVGGTPRRMGNRHPSMSPWNAYHARNGWLLLCSASDDMWGRVCEVVGRPELKHDPRFRDMAGRVANAEHADAALEPWITRHTLAECLEAFIEAAVPCGPVYTIADVLQDQSLLARQAFCGIDNGSAILHVPGPLIHGSPVRGRAPTVPLRAGALSDLPPRGPAASFAGNGSGACAPVLEGIRVVEMGSYTTAPLAARNLGALGAYVVKAEPPQGELSRASPPYREGQSYFCTMSNSDKRSIAVDLRTAEGCALFRELLERADVFIENMKPGVLARFGFGPEEISRMNPRLVYCSVSGYGASSPLANRPAMDTTIQGMAGVMDLTRASGVPYKTGVSISDLLGGQFALLAILAALEYRERSGRGQVIDLSMQELSAWLTQFAWNAPEGAAAGAVLACRDGYVYAADGDLAPDALERLTRHEAVEALAVRGVRAAPVNTVSEVAMHAQTGARALIVERAANDGRVWPLLASPIRLEPAGVEVRRAIGGVGEDLNEVRRDWRLP